MARCGKGGISRRRGRRRRRANRHQTAARPPPGIQMGSHQALNEEGGVEVRLRRKVVDTRAARMRAGS